MGHSPGESADALHAPGLEQLRFQAFPFRDIRVDHQLGLGIALRVAHERPAAFHDDFPAVPGHLAQFADPFPGGHHGLACFVQFGAKTGLREQFVRIAAERLGRRPAVEPLGARVPEDDPIADVTDHDGVLGLGEERCLLTDLLLRLLAGADVALNGDKMADAAILIAQRNRVPLHDELGPIFAVLDRLAGKRTPERQMFLEVLDHAAIGPGAVQDAGRPAEHLGGRVTGQAGEGRIGENDARAGRRQLG